MLNMKHFVEPEIVCEINLFGQRAPCFSSQ